MVWKGLGGSKLKGGFIEWMKMHGKREVLMLILLNTLAAF